MQSPTLRPSRWLAQRLGLSLTTVERFRATFAAERQAAWQCSPATEGVIHVAA